MRKMQRAKPTELTDNSKVRKTKAVIAAQKEAEEDLKNISSKLECPDNVTGIARTEWKRVVKLWSTTEFRYLTDLDIAMLKRYCDSVERYELARKKWADLKKIIVDKEREIQVQIDRVLFEMSRSGDEIERCARALCLTVVDRERLAIAAGKYAKDKKNPLKAFIDE